MNTKNTKKLSAAMGLVLSLAALSSQAAETARVERIVDLPAVTVQLDDALRAELGIARTVTLPAVTVRPDAALRTELAVRAVAARVIDLPTVDKASAPRVVPLEIFVKADQGLVVRQRDARGGVVNEQSLSRAQLPGFIKGLKAKSGASDLSVLIGGDKNARYESVLQVMDELRRNGVQKVGLQVKTSK